MATHGIYPAGTSTASIMAGTAVPVVCEVWYATGANAPSTPSGDAPVAPWVADYDDLPLGGNLWVSERETPTGAWSEPRQVGVVN